MNILLTSILIFILVVAFKRPLLILLGAFVELFVLKPNLDIASLLMSANIKSIAIDDSKGMNKVKKLFFGIIWYSLGKITAFFIEMSFKIIGFVKKEINN